MYISTKVTRSLKGCDFAGMRQVVYFGHMQFPLKGFAFNSALACSTHD